MFPRVWRQQLFLVLSEVVGHLDLLVRQGRVETREREGVLYYRLVGEGAGRAGADAAG